MFREFYEPEEFINEIKQLSDEALMYWIKWPLIDEISFNKAVWDEAKSRGLV